MPSFYLFKLLTAFTKQTVLIAGMLLIPFMVLAGHVRVANIKNARYATGKIAGKVVDEKGEAIAGATIRIVGQPIGGQSIVDGSFSFVVQPGTYTVEVTFVSYQTKRITEVVVKSGEVTSLEVLLKPQSTNLKEVVITSSYRKASTEGLYARQKNAAGITNGISADQIAKTPDANVGQSLKRISGVATFDNKYVIVRGISERYNVATLDGTPLPSTDFTRRNFSFDLIPAEIIEGITVIKTVTPDLPVGFAGGLVQVTTRDIPVKNFVSFGIGTGFNDQSTGKDFISGQRGKYDYFGFDDGTRKIADNLRVTDGRTRPGGAGSSFTDADFAFSRQFTNNWKLYNYTAQPNQNYSFALGRSYNLKNTDNRIGFIGALNYRNIQSIVDIQNTRGLYANSNAAAFGNQTIGGGKIYNFNTTYGGILMLVIVVKRIK